MGKKLFTTKTTKTTKKFSGECFLNSLCGLCGELSLLKKNLACRASWVSHGIALCLSYLICFPLLAQAIPDAKPINLAHEKIIVETLTQKKWVPDKIVASKKNLAGLSAPESQFARFWQGNVPQFDIGFSDLVINFLSASGGKEKPGFRAQVEVFDKLLRVIFSDNILPKFRGGVVFEDHQSQQISRVYLPGKGQQGMLMFIPPWVRGDDVYVLLCPRELVAQGEARLSLRNFPWQIETALFHVYGHTKARLLSGNSSGSIEALIEQTKGIPAGIESSDLARGVNPVVELIYRHKPDFTASHFPESGEQYERFQMSIDMLLPAGYRRKIIEGFNLWLKIVALPQITVALPIGTVLETAAAKAVSRELRGWGGKAGIDTLVDGGPCVLVVGEKNSQERTLSRD